MSSDGCGIGCCGCFIYLLAFIIMASLVFATGPIGVAVFIAVVCFIGWIMSLFEKKEEG